MRVGTMRSRKAATAAAASSSSARIALGQRAAASGERVRRALPQVRTARVRVASEASENGVSTMGDAPVDQSLTSMYGFASNGSSFQLKFVWGSDTLAFAVDQTFGKGQHSPITEYFFWPQDDAWENLKSVLEAKDWIPAAEKVTLLNTVTEVINYWTPQENVAQNTGDQAKAKFPDCNFVGQFN